MTDVKLSKKNHSYLRVDAEPGILMEMHEHFQFEVPGAKFSPKYRAKIWDGKIRLFNIGLKQIYAGLYDHVIEFCSSRGYEVEMLPSGYYGIPGESDNVTTDDIEAFIGELKPTSKGKLLTVRDYQIDAAVHALSNKQAFLISPTASGKSLIQYIVCRYLLQKGYSIMMVVPTVGLVSQMASDFDDYAEFDDSFSAATHIHKITAGEKKESDKPIIITTYQSIYKQTGKYFNQFDCIMIDEGHKIAAATVTGILEKATEVPYRIGCSGTTQDAKCHSLVLQGLTGKFYTVTTTKKLMDEGNVADLTIKCLVLKHSEQVCKALKKVPYQEEIGYIITNSRRNKFIGNLALACEGTVLILFQYKVQGEEIYNDLTARSEDRKVFIITKDTSIEERENIRLLADKEPCIIVASYGTTSTGVNIPSIETLIFAHPSKGKIRNLQSIGRSIRLKDGKSHATLYDIADDLSVKGYINSTLKHFGERIKTYTAEKFKFKITKIDF